MNIKRYISVLLIGAMAASAFTGCSWFKKKSESIISVDSVKSVLDTIGAKESREREPLAANTEAVGMYYIATKDSTVEDILVNKWKSEIKGMDELVDYCYNASGCKLNIIAVRFDSEDEASAFFGQRCEGMAVHKDASGIDTTSNTTNMTLIGDDSFDPENPANIISDGYYIDKEYVLYYTLSLESASDGASEFSGSVFTKLGLENPIDGPMEIIV